MIWVHTEDFSPSQIGVHSTKMSAAITCSEIAGHSSRSQPCSVMSGHTPVAMSWSMARTDSTSTPWRRMISMEILARPSVLETSGERFSVQLMNRARRSEKSQRLCAQSSSCIGVRVTTLLGSQNTYQSLAPGARYTLIPRANGGRPRRAHRGPLGSGRRAEHAPEPRW